MPTHLQFLLWGGPRLGAPRSWPGAVRGPRWARAPAVLPDPARWSWLRGWPAAGAVFGWCCAGGRRGGSGPGQGTGAFLAKFLRCGVGGVGELAGPPHPPADVEVERGNQDGADDDGVEQDAERDGEPQFGGER